MKSKLSIGVISVAITIVAGAFVAPSFAQESTPAEKKEDSRQVGGLFPKDVAGLEQMAKRAIADENGLRLLQTTILLRQQEPYKPRHFVNMVRAYAMMDKPTSAYHYMLQMQQQGLSYDFDQMEEADKLRGTEVYDYLNDLLIRAGEPAGEAEPAFKLDDDYAFPSAIAWDASRGRFLVGTARDGALLSVSDDGEVTELLRADGENGLWAIMGLAVDAEDNRLWVTSAAILQFSGYGNDNAGKAGLFEFKLDSLEPVGRYVLDAENGPHELGPIALDPEGGVYVADRRLAVLYRKTPDSETIAPFVVDHELNGFTDMAISADGSRLYLSDAAKGILVIRPENGNATMLEGPDTLNLGGIEGIFQVGSDLIIVQSGIEPQRLMALTLDPSGGNVEKVRPMAIALEWFDGPSLGTIRGDSVYYFANAGLPGPGEPVEEVTVLKTSLDAGATIVSPDMRKFEEETLSRARNN